MQVWRGLGYLTGAADFVLKVDLGMEHDIIHIEYDVRKYLAMPCQGHSDVPNRTAGEQYIYETPNILRTGIMYFQVKKKCGTDDLFLVQSNTEIMHGDVV